MKKWVSILLAVIVSISIFGCGAESKQEIASVYYDEERLANHFSSFYLGSVHQEISGQTMTGTFDEMEGMVMLWVFEPQEDLALDLTYQLKVKSGKVKLIFVSGDDRVTTITEYFGPNDIEDYKTVALSAKNGYNCVKLVADENASVVYDIRISQGSFINVE